MNITRSIIIAAALAVFLGPALALADPESDVGYRGWGPRVGLSMDPDQIHFGAHLDYGNFAQHVRFQPNFELGFSDNLNLFALNFEAAYRFSSRWDVWSPYVGGGLGANIKNYDNDKRNGSDTDLAANVLGGIEKGLASGNRFFVEMKLSLNDIPDVKLTVGWTFYH